MALAATVLTSSTSTANQSTAYATSSFTAAADSLMCVWLAGSGNVTYTLSGQSLTWTREGHYNFSGTARVMELHTAPVGGSPGTGALSATPSAAATGCAMSVVAFTGHDVATPIVGALVDSSGSNVASLTSTLPSAASSGNRSVRGFFATNNTANTITPPTGWTEFHEVLYVTPSTKVETAWHPTAFQTSVVGTEDSTYDLGQIAFELAAAAVGGPGAGLPDLVMAYRS